MRFRVLAVLVLAASAQARPLVVLIDPGHGGSNLGAPSRRAGVYEKEVTLSIAVLLQRALQGLGHRALLTRDRDRLLTVRQRSRQAKEVGADLFISVHTNAASAHNRRGTETYVIDHQMAELDGYERAVSKDAASALVSHLNDFEVRKQSIALAQAVQHALVGKRSTEENRGVREGGYDVLAGLEIPAVLVEVGFLDHPTEGMRLLKAVEQQRIAQEIAGAIEQFSKAGAAIPPS